MKTITNTEHKEIIVPNKKITLLHLAIYGVLFSAWLVLKLQA